MMADQGPDFLEELESVIVFSNHPFLWAHCPSYLFSLTNTMNIYLSIQDFSFSVLGVFEDNQLQAKLKFSFLCPVGGLSLEETANRAEKGKLQFWS